MSLSRKENQQLCEIIHTPYNSPIQKAQPHESRICRVLQPSSLSDLGSAPSLCLDVAPYTFTFLPAFETFQLHANVDILEEYRPPSFLNKMFLHPGVCVTSLGYNEATHSQQNCFPGEVETHGVHLSLPLMLTLITWSRCSLTPTPTPRDPLHHRELVGIWARSQKTAWSSTVSSQTACGLEGKLSGYDDAAQSLIPGMAPGR